MPLDLSNYFGGAGYLWAYRDWIDSSQWVSYWINHLSSEASRAHTYAQHTRINIVRIKVSKF